MTSNQSSLYQGKNEDDTMSRVRELVEEYNEENGIEQKFIDLSKEQQIALDMFKESKNLLIIGEAGCGKSKLISEMKYHTNKETSKKIVVTATTGIASYNINGITINAFLGIGTGEQDIDIIVRKIQRKPPIRDRIRNVDILVIDEVSMMSAELFEKINAVCQTIRRSSAPFGGIQVVLTGDFFQMTPVFNRNVQLLGDQDTRLMFESKVFTKYFTKKNTVNLKKNFRQNDIAFLRILQKIRTGEYTEEDINVLKSRMVSKLKLSKDGSELKDAVHLVATNRQAQEINRMNLGMNNESSVKYLATYTETGDPEITKELKKELQTQFLQKGINEIELKKNVRVMLLKNLSVEEGLVNGSIGTVTDFVSGFPVVKFDIGIERVITCVEWELDLSGSACKATQLPLMLCWAVTIHKIQGITLDKAVMDLGGCFCHHQVYTALSRVRTLDGLFLETFDPKKIIVNEKAKTYLGSLEKSI